MPPFFSQQKYELSKAQKFYDLPILFQHSVCNQNTIKNGIIIQLVWLSSWPLTQEPKGNWFDSLSEHTLGLWAQSPVSCAQEAAV